MKELRETFLQGKTPLMLEKVQDIHVVCGFLKDFLRKLKEPLITFRLHQRFMEASGGHTHTHADSLMPNNLLIFRRLNLRVCCIFSRQLVWCAKLFVLVPSRTDL